MASLGGCSRLFCRSAATAPLRRYLFLDIDGVLHPSGVKAQADWFSSSCMAELQRIVERSSCQIVLSSTWRASPTLVGAVNAALEQRGLAPVVLATPSIKDSSGDLPASVLRAREIQAWRRRATLEDVKVAPWCVIDDLRLEAFWEMNMMDAACEELQDHFVRTKPRVGLTAEDANLAIAILSREPNYSDVVKQSG
eukprot:TRINITY_DN53138_c0_g1_i1.p1 TRINITY_DN53138_c0_g1~~TRINITY_DN53138_c0_g1_i1.p1  ORF type:complete len:219 (-),score=49.08 TRINITY_DN53138_c0_g1_i1:772-1359(-)